MRRLIKNHEYQFAGYGGESFCRCLAGMVDSHLRPVLATMISGVSVAGNTGNIYQAIFIALGLLLPVSSPRLWPREIRCLAYHTAEAIKLTLLLCLRHWASSLFLAGRCWICWGRKKRWLKGKVRFNSGAGGTIVLLGLMTSLEL